MSTLIRKILILSFVVVDMTIFNISSNLIIKNFFPSSHINRPADQITTNFATTDNYTVLPLTKLVEVKIQPFQKVITDDLVVELKTSPAPIKAGEWTKMYWTISDAKTGNLVELDMSIHPSQHQLSHAYGFHEDLAGEMIHIHPRIKQTGAGTLEDSLVFDRPGKWYFVAQISRNNTLYNFRSELDVSGTIKKDILKINTDWTKKVGNYKITLSANPSKIKKNIPADIKFSFENTSTHVEPMINQQLLGSNMLFALQGKNIIWNEHGDGSVENISPQSGFSVKRHGATTNSVSYRLTFPEAGLWRIRLELAGAGDFYLAVGD